MGEDLPHVEDAYVSGVRAFEESDESADDSTPLQRWFKRSAIGKGMTEDNVVDMTSEQISLASIVADAAFDLDVECSKLCQVPRSLGAADIACALTERTDSAEVEQPYEERDCDDSDSDSEDEDDIPRPRSKREQSNPPSR